MFGYKIIGLYFGSNVGDANHLREKTSPMGMLFNALCIEKNLYLGCPY